MKTLSDKRLRLKVFEKTNGRCAYCGTDLVFEKFQVDHFVPKNRGIKDYSKRGSDKIENLLPSCGSCNSSKSNFPLESWRRELSLKLERINRDVSNYRILKRFGIITENPKEIVFYFETISNGN